MRTKKRLWRWRSNPLKRPSDVLESVVVLVAMVLVLVGGPAVAVMAGRSTHDTLRQQRLDRHPATAFLVENAPGRAPSTGYESGDNGKVAVTVRWRDAQGSVHTGMAQAEPGRRAGSALAIWLDGHNRLTKQPLDPVDSVITAALTGTAAAVGWCTAVWLAVRGVRLCLDRRRARLWDREWERVGPRWGHKQT
ncbi:Rv1733c family protein [Streptomyces purpurogeneiscleroticus]|uniref:Rv1733c family protein n=1 Tax=Streptomyces purpurogeneiscleroticus TaxID=68259 RepID=UPI001CC11ABD|nr:hypothetical protein [Streptomyces purpurogeneiscleroticus]MBZ4019639.1 hypothetical protein [Streptomyces purpurogeneiscleroticus]